MKPRNSPTKFPDEAAPANVNSPCCMALTAGYERGGMDVIMNLIDEISHSKAKGAQSRTKKRKSEDTLGRWRGRYRRVEGGIDAAMDPRMASRVSGDKRQAVHKSIKS